MQFGVFDLAECEGGILAHTVFLAGRKLVKGTCLTADHIAALGQQGVASLTIARLEEGDLAEDAAATRLATTIMPATVRLSAAATGRVNIYAPARGIVRVDRDLMRRINMIDEGITLATVQHNQLLEQGDMIATLKIIPYGVSQRAIDKVIAQVGTEAAFTFHPLAAKRFALIQTVLPEMKQSVLNATETTTKGRLNQLDCALVDSHIVAHEPADVGAAIESALVHGAQVVLVCGASAISDRRDVVPSGILAAGGVIDHLGLPADPGNLLMTAHVKDVPIIGMPGCARSPRLNGFDWVLQLTLAGIPVDDQEIAEMAVGGLLMEIASRPLPRKMVERRPDANQTVGAVLLAAGQSRRMAGRNKLLLPIDGVPMIRRCARALLDAGLRDIVVVTGFEDAQVRAALADLDVRFVHNENYDSGQAGSVACGITAIDTGHIAALVALGDMPLIAPDLIAALVADHLALRRGYSRITFPTHDGKRGNPVIWGQAFFDELKSLRGDSGGRQILDMHSMAVNSLNWPDPAIHHDIDTDAGLENITSSLTSNRTG